MEKQPPSSDSEGKKNTSRASSAHCYRQIEARSVTVHHQMPPQRHEVRIEMEPYNRFSATTDNQLHSNSGFSTIDRSTLSKLVREKSLDGLADLGGLEGIKNSLKTDLNNGIGGEVYEISQRAKAFGTNAYVEPPVKSFFSFMWEAFKDPTMVILLACAALLLGFVIKKSGHKEGWYDGGGIIVAVFLVASVSAMSNYRQYIQLERVSKKKNNISVRVMRNCMRQKISIFEIVVGDVVCLSIGDQVPADGLFAGGYSLMVDESSMTGESDHVAIHKENPFLLSGCKVTDGSATMLVTSVGMNTTWGEMMSLISTESNLQTPIQERLKKLILSTGMIGLAVGFLLLAMLLVRYFTGHSAYENGNKEFIAGKTKVDDVIDAMAGIIAAAVTVVVVAIPEGLSSAVTLTTSYMMKRMMSDQAMIRNLSACETMGSATTICTDIRSILSSKKMNVTTSLIGNKRMEGRSYTSIAANVRQPLAQGIILTRESAHKLFTVTPTDDAIYEWAENKMNMDMDNATEGLSILDVKASCTENGRMVIIVKSQSDNMIHVHWRGEFERILSLCSHYYDVTGHTVVLDERERERFRQTIEDTSARELRCIALAYRQIPEEEYEEERANNETLDTKLILVGVVGLKGFYRPDTKQAIETLKLAGVKVNMITGDNVSTAIAIAMECGILSSSQVENDGSIVTSEEFRRYTEKERIDKVKNISVLARSSPRDKLLMVRCLRETGHVVAVTGDGTNDSPALRESDVGLSLGIQGTEVEKENSDIIILDDDFETVSRVVRWGRCVYNNIQKFIQFQLTVTVASAVIIFVTAVSTGKTPLTPAQILWVYLIMDTLGALALATDKPSKELMNRPPVGRNDPLITNIMLRNIIGQALYQIGVILALKFKGNAIFHVHGNVVDTHVFTTLVLLQVLNMFNARKLETKNIFQGILKNKWFLGITGTIIILQVLMVEFLNKFSHTERLDWKQWVVSIVIAALSWPIGWLLKFLPVPEWPILNHRII